MRPIDADELKGHFPQDEDWDYPVNTNSRVVEIIDNALTVDPVKHGEWIPKITELGTMIFRCSACRRFSDIHWAYCPQCGAKMDGERREDGKVN